MTAVGEIQVKTVELKDSSGESPSVVAGFPVAIVAGAIVVEVAIRVMV